MNDYVPNVAAIERSKSVLDQLQKHTEKEPWEARRNRLRKELTAGGDYKVKNDLATALAQTGEAAEAVTLLEQIEAEKPGLYVTAANLGTAYELSGDDEKALEWIRKGIELNADAHEGTEWLHVRILEAKLALKTDPKWLDAHSIVDPTKNLAAPGLFAAGNRGEKLSTKQIKNALIYQLHERLQFVRPPDAVVGSLLVELGCFIREEPPGTAAAQGVFALAATYLKDIPNVDSLQTIADKLHLQAQRGWRSHTAIKYEVDRVALSIAGIAGVLLGTLLIGLKRLMQRKRAVQSATAHPNGAL